MENEQIVIELKELLYMEFRRYLYRRKANVTAQSILLAIGYNINKLHYKIQAGRTGRHLFPLKQTAWFWQVKSKSWKRTFFQKRFIKVRLLVETEWKERIFRLKNGKKMLPHLWFPNHWCDYPKRSKRSFREFPKRWLRKKIPLSKLRFADFAG